MKTTAKIISVLLCAGLLLSLCACGKEEKDNNVAENQQSQEVMTDNTVPDDTQAPTSDDNQPTNKKEDSTGDIDLGDGIILPEDGKITFGGDNENTVQTPDEQKPTQEQEEGDKPTGNQTPSEEQDWGEVEWN